MIHSEPWMQQWVIRIRFIKELGLVLRSVHSSELLPGQIALEHILRAPTFNPSLSVVSVELNKYFRLKNEL